MFVERLPNTFGRAGALFGAIAGLVFFSSCAVAQTSAAYGPNDRLGALNNLSPEIVLRAVGLVKTGKVYSLAGETKPNAPTPENRVFRVIIQPFSAPSSNKLTGYEDTVMLSPSLGTSMDGLGHVGRDGIHYNGVRAEEVYDSHYLHGAKTFGMDTLPPIVTRGVLLDVARFQRESGSQAIVITKANIESMAQAQGIAIRRGDVVLLHTGRLEAAEAPPSTTAAPGIGKEAALYLARLGVVAVGGDPGPDVLIEDEGEVALTHQILLVDHGVYILEGVKTAELASDRAYEFLFVAAAPRLVGTVQATIHPVAIR